MKRGRYNTQAVHGFRKRFNTILKLNKDVNDNAIEKMLGHQNGLDGVYLQITKDKLFEEFKAGIIDLTINPAERQKVKIEELKTEKNTVDKLVKRIDIMSERLYDQQTKLLDEGKDVSHDQLRQFADLVLLKMDAEPEFKESFTKMLQEWKASQN